MIDTLTYFILNNETQNYTTKKLEIKLIPIK